MRGMSSYDYKQRYHSLKVNLGMRVMLLCLLILIYVRKIVVIKKNKKLKGFVMVNFSLMHFPIISGIWRWEGCLHIIIYTDIMAWKVKLEKKVSDFIERVRDNYRKKLRHC